MNKTEALRMALEALEKLARLGNGDTYGNSIGNVIAQAAITAIKEALAQSSDSVEKPVDFELAYGGIYKDQRAALAEALALTSTTCEVQPEQDVAYWIRQHTAAQQAELELRRELEATERQVEILTDELAKCQRKLDVLAQPEQEPWCMKMNGCKTKCEDCPDEVAQSEHIPDAGKMVLLPEQEPFIPDWVSYRQGKLDGVAEYLEEAKREWVGLTDADIFEAEFNRPELMTIGEFISNKLKELNHG
jgi:hypothetical protein